MQGTPAGFPPGMPGMGLVINPGTSLNLELFPEGACPAYVCL